MRNHDDLTRDELEQFDREGYVFLGRVLTDDERAALQRRLDQIMLGTVRYEGLRAQSHRLGTISDGDAWDSTLAYRKIGCLYLDDLFLTYFQKPLFRNIARHFIGADVALQRDMLFNNYPHEGGIGFHQDGGENWNRAYDPDPVITIWTALDCATVRNGCVQVIPGTHKTLIPLAQVSDVVSRHSTVPLEVEAGEAILLHNWTLHGSERNESEEPRRAVTVCYCDALLRQEGEPVNPPRVFGRGAMRPGVPRSAAEVTGGGETMMTR